MSGRRDPRWVKFMPLGELKPAKRNPKRHAIPLITLSIKKHEFVDPFVLDERTGRLAVGHGRGESLQQMKQRGDPPPQGVIVRGGEWFVPVYRGWRSKNDADLESYLIGNNKLPEQGGWDEGAELADMLRDIGKADQELLATTGFDEEEIGKMLSATAPTGRRRLTDEELDQFDKKAGEIWVKRGELYRLGDHRILCGNSLKRLNGDGYFVDLDRLLDGEKVVEVVEDPPYSIFGSSTGVHSSIADTKMVMPFLETTLLVARNRLPMYGHAYVFCDWRSVGPWQMAAYSIGLGVKNKIIWGKGAPEDEAHPGTPAGRLSGMGSSWVNTYEECWYFSRVPQKTTMKSGNPAGVKVVYEPNLQYVPRPHGEDREHNAAKPVGLLRKMVLAGSKHGDVVLDCFCGSGSTLIACEAEGRRCFTIDAEPSWVQVTINRWQKMTGGKAVRLG